MPGSESENIVLVTDWFHSYFAAAVYSQFLAPDGELHLVQKQRDRDTRNLQKLKDVVGGLSRARVIYFSTIYSAIVPKELAYLETQKRAGQVTNMELFGKSFFSCDKMTKYFDKINYSFSSFGAVLEEVARQKETRYPELEIFSSLTRRFSWLLTQQISLRVNPELMTKKLLFSYILNCILSERKIWELFYTEGASAACRMIKEEDEIYKRMRAVNSLSTENSKIFLKKVYEAKKKLKKNHRQVKISVGDRMVKILVIKISKLVADYGSLIEELVRKKMSLENAEYAIMLNSANQEASDVKFHLFLRSAVEQDRDAASLNEVLKNMGIVTIGDQCEIDLSSCKNLMRALNLQDFLSSFPHMLGCPNCRFEQPVCPDIHRPEASVQASTEMNSRLNQCGSPDIHRPEASAQASTEMTSRLNQCGSFHRREAAVQASETIGNELFAISLLYLMVTFCFFFLGHCFGAVNLGEEVFIRSLFLLIYFQFQKPLIIQLHARQIHVDRAQQLYAPNAQSFEAHAVEQFNMHTGDGAAHYENVNTPNRS